MSDKKSFKLVPASMLLDKDTIEAINFHCGDGDGDDSQFGEYSDGLLWIGTVTDDDGKEVYGLHLATAEYPEEGSTTLVEFEAPEDTALSRLAALREELASVSRSFDELAEIVGFSEDRLTQSGDSPMDCAKQLQQRLADAERRNGEHIIILKHFANLADVRNVGTHAMDYVSALNPNPEAASHDE